MTSAASADVVVGPAARPAGIETFIARRLPWLYLIYAVPMVIFLSVIMGPFQVPDELAHFLRADQVSRGDLVAKSIGPQNTGGMVDEGIRTLGRLYEGMWFRPHVKQTVEKAREAGAIRWSGRSEEASFGNSGLYGPILYLPQAAGIKLGQAIGLNVAATMVLARIINGLAACAVGFCAIALCRRGRALTFATLTLPMDFSQFGSVSQDALIIALSILAVTVAGRVLAQERPATTPEFAIVVFIVTATTLARASQLPLAFLLLALVQWPRDRDWRTKGALVAAAAVAVIIWMFVIKRLMPRWPDGVSVPDQFAYLLAHPFALLAAIVGTYPIKGEEILKSTVGIMGWLDTRMPLWFYWTAAAILALAALAPGNRGPLLRPALLAVVTVATFFLAICGALYLTWSPVGHQYVEGIQGRYLLPVLPLAAWLLPAYGPRLASLLMPAWYPVLLFPLLTIAIMPGVIVERYYGSWSVMADVLPLFLRP